MEGLNVPVAQSVHDVEPPRLYAPAAQGAQAEGASAKVPAGQEVAEKAQDCAPSTLNEPPPHKGQTDWPGSGLYDPAAQGAQEEGARAWVPAGQEVKL